MRLYLRWYREGYLSVNGRCFDIGNATREALESFSRTGEPFSGSTDRYSAGNGSLMRLAPVPMAFAAHPEEAIRLAGESSRTTHGAAECVDACRFFAALLIGALTGVDKAELLTPMYSPVPGLWEREPLCPTIDSVAAGSYRTKEQPAIRGTGHVVRSLEAALWAVQKGMRFEDSVLLAVNLGEDADTTGAICGQLAGALYGAEAIPAALKSGLAQESALSDFAERLYHLSGVL
jgi:ADP-ribosylglycohydrolase